MFVNLFLVYLRSDPKVVYERVKARARVEECHVPLEYLEQLHKIHEDWLYNKTAFSCPLPVSSQFSYLQLRNVDI